MPRGTDGTYNPPEGTLVNSGDTILVSQHNPFVNDVAQALTNSLDRNGSGGMRAALNMGGFPVQNAAQGSSPNDLATVSQASAFSLPVGSIVDYAGSVAPSGYLMCYGQAVSRSGFPALFATIGTIYGSGDGSTTFNVPDTRGRVTAAPDNMGGTAANRMSVFPAVSLGASGGADRHTLSLAESPSHSHDVIDPGHNHTVVRNVTPGTGSFQGGGTSGGNTDDVTGASVTGISVQPSGGGGAHNNTQPTIIFNKIIRAI